MEKYLNFINEIVTLLKNYGIDVVYWIFVFAYVAGLIFPEFAHDLIVSNNVIVFGVVYLAVKYLNSQAKKENFQNVSKIRYQASNNVRVELGKLLAETKADRAYVFEFHNGKQNATNMAFTYLDMTHEECLKGIHYISDECQNMSTTLYNISDFLLENYKFTGTLDELEEIDPKMARRLSNDALCYTGMILLRSNGIDIGFLGVSFEEKTKINETDLITSLSIYAQDISDYLDLRKYQK